MTKFYCLALLLLATLTFAQSPVPPGAKLEKIATGFLFVEGPLWKDGSGLLFSDIPADKIYLWSPSDSSLKTYLFPSDSSNGLTYDKQGNLILTQMKKRRVSRQESNGTITPLVSTYNGKRFNCPNDLVVRSDGSLFFTDPDFNIPYPSISEVKIKGIYRLSPSGNLSVIDSTFDKPNGICLSPDEKKLYVNESPRGRIYAWDIVNDSTITNKKLLYTIPTQGYADGMKTDPDGNIYCTGPTGVWIVSPAGQYLDKIATPETPANCNWGDSDRKTLYITAGKSVYRIRLAPVTGTEKQGNLPTESFELYTNYPNPFNPSTTIEFNLPSSQNVELKILDVQGHEVANLLKDYLNAGNHKVEFNASSRTGLASGAYFYQLTAGDYIQTKKLVFLK